MSTAVDSFPLQAQRHHPASQPGARTVVVIGRAADSDVVLDNMTVSRRHAALVRTDGGWTIEDLGSTNGTAVNGVRIRDRRSVRIGDVLMFGAAARRLGPEGLDLD